MVGMKMGEIPHVFQHVGMGLLVVKNLIQHIILIPSPPLTILIPQIKPHPITLFQTNSLIPPHQPSITTQPIPFKHNLGFPLSSFQSQSLSSFKPNPHLQTCKPHHSTPSSSSSFLGMSFLCKQNPSLSFPFPLFSLTSHHHSCVCLNNC